MANLESILTLYKPLFDQNKTADFEADVANNEQEICLSDEEIVALRNFANDYPLHVAEEIKRIAFEGHLMPFGYTRERVEEYERIDRIYHQQ